MNDSTMPPSAVDCFPTIMQCADLMAMVQAGPKVLELCSIVQFPVYKSNAYSLQDFVSALQTNDTIVSIHCNRHFTTGFNDEEWCQILVAFGMVQRLENLVFVDGGDSRLRRLSIDLLANILTSTTSNTTNGQRQRPQRNLGRLRKLELQKFWLLMGNDGHRRRLAAALHNHPTLESFTYAGCGIHTQLYQSIAPRTDPNAIIEALATCRKLQSVHITNSPYCAYDYSVAGVLTLLDTRSQLRCLSLVTRPSNWKMVGSAIHRVSSTLERLTLIHSGRNDAATGDALISLLQHVGHASQLRYLALHLCGTKVYFPQTGLDQHDKRRRWSGILADVIRQHSSLQMVELSDSSGYGYENTITSAVPISKSLMDDNNDPFTNAALPFCRHYCAHKTYRDTRDASDPSLDVSDFEVLADAVQANGQVQVFVDVGFSVTNQAITTAFNRLSMESMLNAVRLQATLTTVNDDNVDDEKDEDVTKRYIQYLSTLNELPLSVNDETVVQSCLYSLVRSNPLLCYRHAH